MSLLLMTPGPTRVPDRVLAAGATPMIHHRTGEFSSLLSSTIARLRPLFGTAGDVLPVHATGRGSLEAAVTNLLSPGDEVIACCNGLFGEMWAGIAEQFGVVVHRFCRDWDASADPMQIAAALESYPHASRRSSRPQRHIDRRPEQRGCHCERSPAFGRPGNGRRGQLARRYAISLRRLGRRRGRDRLAKVPDVEPRPFLYCDERPSLESA